MVIDDVEHDRDANRMGAVDEGAEVVGPAVEPRGRKQVDPVIPPSELAGKIADRHDLDGRDARPDHRAQFGERCPPAAFACEGADVNLANDEIAHRDPGPGAIRPGKRGRVDHFRPAVRAARLEARRRVGHFEAVFEATGVPRSGARLPDAPVEVAVDSADERLNSRRGCRRLVRRAPHDGQFTRGRCPHAKMRATAGLKLGADRQTSCDGWERSVDRSHDEGEAAEGLMAE